MAVSPDLLAINLGVEEEKKLLKVKALSISPFELAEKYVSDRGSILLKDKLIILKSVKTFMIEELFHHPLIRSKILLKFFEKA